MLGKPLEQIPVELEGLQLAPTPTVARLERRRRQRSHVHWPVCFFGVDVGRTVETTTENLSSSGFHCFTPVPLITGDTMVCVLGVPSPQPFNNTRALCMECKVRIVRMEPAEDRKSYSVGCEIQDYRFIESNHLFLHLMK